MTLDHRREPLVETWVRRQGPHIGDRFTDAEGEWEVINQGTTKDASLGKGAPPAGGDGERRCSLGGARDRKEDPPPQHQAWHLIRRTAPDLC